MCTSRTDVVCSDNGAKDKREKGCIKVEDNYMPLVEVPYAAINFVVPHDYKNPIATMDQQLVKRQRGLWSRSQ